MEEERQYLIPANTKRGRLLFGWFRPFDLALVGAGVLVTFILLAFMPMDGIWMLIVVLAPAIITAFLVMPVPYYHNILSIIIDVYEYFTNRQTYRWKGWCWKDGK